MCDWTTGVYGLPLDGHECVFKKSDLSKRHMNLKHKRRPPRPKLINCFVNLLYRFF